MQDFAGLRLEPVAACMVVFLLDLAEALQDAVHVAGLCRVAHRMLQRLELVMQIAETTAAGNRLVEDRTAGHLFDILAKIAEGHLLRHRHVALVRRLLAGDHPEDRRLAGAVRADKADLFSWVELEGGLNKEHLPAVLLADAGKREHEVLSVYARGGNGSPVDCALQRRYGEIVAAPPLARLFGIPGRRTLESIAPRRTFDDVILPPATRRALDIALSQVTQHDLIFNRWGLGERHPTGLALAFNFAGPPGTGKTICAEAIAHSLGRRLLVVRYAELESLWMGETPKNVTAIFRAARDEGAVLFFDEADAIASRRSTSVEHGFQRESNTVVSVLLQELERYNGVVIFATNLAANFDPAFERRIRTHVLFEMPGPAEREQIWRVQMHPSRTPLAEDVDLRSLAEKYAVSGGDIRNAVLKAALAAAAERGPDSAKRIHQRHLVAGIEDVVTAGRVMRQSLFTGDDQPGSDARAVLADTASARLLTYGLALAGSALIVAIVALVVALLK